MLTVVAMLVQAASDRDIVTTKIIPLIAISIVLLILITPNAYAQTSGPLQVGLLQAQML